MGTSHESDLTESVIGNSEDYIQLEVSLEELSCFPEIESPDTSNTDTLPLTDKEHLTNNYTPESSPSKLNNPFRSHPEQIEVTTVQTPHPIIADQSTELVKIVTIDVSDSLVLGEKRSELLSQETNLGPLN